MSNYGEHRRVWLIRGIVHGLQCLLDWAKSCASLPQAEDCALAWHLGGRTVRHLQCEHFLSR
eukprot:3298343-Amphidinium_carterae.1